MSSYTKKYAALKKEVTALQGKGFLQAANFPALVPEGALTEQTAKPAFFGLLRGCIAENLSSTRQIHPEVQQSICNAKQASLHPDEEDAHLVENEEIMLVYLYENAEAVLGKKLHDIVRPFYSNPEASTKAANWLIAIALHATLLKTQDKRKADLLRDVLLGFISHNASSATIEDVKQTFEAYDPLLTPNDFIFSRLMDAGKEVVEESAAKPADPARPEFLRKAKSLLPWQQKTATPIGPYYKNTIYDELKKWIDDNKHDKLTTEQFKLECSDFISLFKSLYAKLGSAKQEKLKSFFKKVVAFENKVKTVEQEDKLGISGKKDKSWDDSTEARFMQKAIRDRENTKAAMALKEEAIKLFRECMPGTIEYQILGVGLIILGLGLIATGLTLLILMPPALGLALSIGLSGVALIGAGGSSWGIRQCFFVSQEHERNIKTINNATIKAINYASTPGRAPNKVEKVKEKTPRGDSSGSGSGSEEFRSGSEEFHSAEWKDLTHELDVTNPGVRVRF